MGHCQIERDTAKNLYQALTFGSGFTAWVEDEKRKVGRRRLDALPMAKEHQVAVRQYMQAVATAHPAQLDVVKAWKDPKTGKGKEHPEAALLSHLPCQLEERKMTNAMRRCGQVQSILHDEIMFDKPNNEAATVELLQRCNAAMIQAVQPGMTCEIKCPELPEWFDPDAKIFL